MAFNKLSTAVTQLIPANMPASNMYITYEYL